MNDFAESLDPARIRNFARERGWRHLRPLSSRNNSSEPSRPAAAKLHCCGHDGAIAPRPCGEVQQALADVIANACGVSWPDETAMVTGNGCELVKLMPVGA